MPAVASVRVTAVSPRSEPETIAPRPEHLREPRHATPADADQVASFAGDIKGLVQGGAMVGRSVVRGACFGAWSSYRRYRQSRRAEPKTSVRSRHVRSRPYKIACLCELRDDQGDTCCCIVQSPQQGLYSPIGGKLETARRKPHPVPAARSPKRLADRRPRSPAPRRDYLRRVTDPPTAPRPPTG